MSLFHIVEHLLGELQLLVELLAEGADNRLLEALIYRDVEALAALSCAAAYCPAVVVEACRAIPEARNANRVEVARQWLNKRALALAVCSLYGAEGYAILLLIALLFRYLSENR